MTPDEIMAIRQRAAAAIESVNRMEADQKARELGIVGDQAPPERPGWPPPPRNPPPLPKFEPAPEPVELRPVQRLHGPRDFGAEMIWIQGICRALVLPLIERKVAELVEGIGEALAEERTAMRKEFEAKIESMIGAMKAEFRTALAADTRSLDAVLKRMDRLLDQWQQLEWRAGSKTIDVRPH
jgi:hypothetical protein